MPAHVIQMNRKHSLWMTVICVGVMVWEQLGLPKSQGRQCREERAWPGKDGAWKHKQSSRLLF